jgi:hypothetical protein
LEAQIQSLDIFLAAYNATAPQALALRPDQLQPNVIGVMDLVGLGLRAHGNIAHLREKFAHHKFDLEAFDALRTLSLATGYAHMAHAPFLVSARVPQSEKTDLAIGRKHRKTCAFEAVLCVDRGLITQDQFDGIATGVGYEDVGRAVLGYIHVFRRNFALIQGTTKLREHDLDAMQLVGERLVLVGSDRKVTPVGNATETADMLLRTYSLLHHAYKQVRRGLNYIFDDEPEQVRALAPTVQQVRLTKSSPGTVAAPDDEEKESPDQERSAAE